MVDDIVEVLPGVRVFSVNLVGDSLLIDVYGGEQLVVSTVRFEIDESWGWQKLMAEAVEWAMTETPLTYVRLLDGGVRLVPESLDD